MLIDIIKNRRSVREYESRDVSNELIIELIEHARLAPSAKNLQEWKFIIVKDKEKRQKLSEAAKNQKFVSEAPVVIAGVATYTDYVMSNGIPACHIDVAIAMEHIALAAAEKGLGTCWIGAFYQDKAKEILKVPENCKIIALMTLGYPKEDGKEKIRKRIDEIICWEEFK
ncbi:MAG: nitroreductase family protein [Thermoplasmatales archaeon]|nr:nitroreductase family protein [Thermoplasmatales archaeon]